MRSFLLAVVLASVPLLMGPEGGCGVSSGGKDEGEPCTRTGECGPALVCRGGECMQSPDAGSEPVDAGLRLDGGDLDAGEVDGGVEDAGDAGADGSVSADGSV